MKYFKAIGSKGTCLMTITSKDIDSEKIQDAVNYFQTNLPNYFRSSWKRSGKVVVANNTVHYGTELIS